MSGEEVKRGEEDTGDAHRVSHLVCIVFIREGRRMEGKTKIGAIWYGRTRREEGEEGGIGAGINEGEREEEHISHSPTLYFFVAVAVYHSTIFPTIPFCSTSMQPSPVLGFFLRVYTKFLQQSLIYSSPLNTKLVKESRLFII